MDAMKLTGFEFQHLKFDDGKEIDGARLYLSYPREGVTGLVSYTVFVSMKKLGDYVPKLGDSVNLFYNRFGKVDSIRLAA